MPAKEYETISELLSSQEAKVIYFNSHEDLRQKLEDKKAKPGRNDDDQLYLNLPYARNKVSRKATSMGRYDGLTGALVFNVDAPTTRALSGALNNRPLQASFPDLRFPQLLNSLETGAWLADVGEKGYVYLNGAFGRIYGRKLGDFHENPQLWLEMVHPEDRQKAEESGERLKRGENVACTFRIIRPDGQVRWIFDNKKAVKNSSGTIVQFGGLVSDITEEKREQMELHNLRTAVAQADEHVLITGADGLIEYVNPAFERDTGYAMNEIVGRNPRFLRSERQDNGVYRDMWTTIQSGRAWSGRVVNCRKDGSEYTGNCTITPILNEEGEIIRFVQTKRDITRELFLENEKRQNGRIESVSRLTSEVAHDFNNIIQIIVSCCGIMEQMDPRGADAKKYVQLIESSARQASELTRKLLSFSRKRDIQPIHLNLNEVVENQMNMLRRLTREDIRIHFDPTEDLTEKIYADRIQIEQILMNLSVNARDAMPNGGILTIRTSKVIPNCQLGTAENTEREPNGYVILTVEDNGTGMDKETIQHIFEPFYTTKREGQGTGLGLSTVYGIVREMGGSIDVESQPGEGTLFRIWFPVSKEVEEKPATEEQGKPQGQGEMILLAEDNMDLRNLISNLLKGNGYRVVPCQDGREALRLAEEAGKSFDLVILDAVMPSMNGHEAMLRIRELTANQRFLLLSGYNQKDLTHFAELKEEVTWLKKPFNSQVLLKTVHATLHGSEESGTRGFVESAAS